MILIMGVMYGVALWSRGVLKQRTLLFARGALRRAFCLFSFSYQSEIREFRSVDTAKQYDNIRLDYGRDHVIRSTLYAELHASPSHSRVPDAESPLRRSDARASYLVAREAWPYAVYATAAAFRLPVRFLGWGVTTSWLEEAVANLGWCGLLAGPLLLAWICRIGESSKDTIARLLTILMGSLLLAVQAVAFAPVIAIWGVAVFHAWRVRSRIAREWVVSEPQCFTERPARRPALSL